MVTKTLFAHYIMSQYAKLPLQLTEKILIGDRYGDLEDKSLSELTKLRAVDRTLRNRVDREIERRHTEQFGHANKSISLKIQDLLTERILQKISVPLMDVDFQYGLSIPVGPECAIAQGLYYLRSTGIIQMQPSGNPPPTISVMEGLLKNERTRKRSTRAEASEILKDRPSKWKRGEEYSLYLPGLIKERDQLLALFSGPDESLIRAEIMQSYYHIIAHARKRKIELRGSGAVRNNIEQQLFGQPPNLELMVAYDRLFVLADYNRQRILPLVTSRLKDALSQKLDAKGFKALATEALTKGTIDGMPVIDARSAVHALYRSHGVYRDEYTPNRGILKKVVSFDLTTGNDLRVGADGRYGIEADTIKATDDVLLKGQFMAARIQARHDLRLTTGERKFLLELIDRNEQRITDHVASGRPLRALLGMPHCVDWLNFVDETDATYAKLEQLIASKVGGAVTERDLWQAGLIVGEGYEEDDDDGDGDDGDE